MINVVASIIYHFLSGYISHRHTKMKKLDNVRKYYYEGQEICKRRSECAVDV